MVQDDNVALSQPLSFRGDYTFILQSLGLSAAGFAVAGLPPTRWPLLSNGVPVWRLYKQNFLGPSWQQLLASSAG